MPLFGCRNERNTMTAANAAHTNDMPMNDMPMTDEAEAAVTPANDQPEKPARQKKSAAKGADTAGSLSFTDLDLPEILTDALTKMNFTTPTPIQEAAIPLALQGRDVLGSAQTGTGKTIAFGVPLVAHLINNKEHMALIMTPTRELAAQVLKSLQQFLPASIKSALLIGGEPMPKQFNQLKFRPRLIVGTPGRINDHLERGSVNLSAAHFLVLDETDRMLDMGFGIQLKEIEKYLPQQRQTLMFSATMEKEIVRLAGQYQNNPERIAVGSTRAPATKIVQETIKTTEGDKYKHLTEQLEKRTGSVIIFVKTKFGAARLADRLNREGDDNQVADAIHGDLRQNQRDKVILRFRNMKYRVLVATDVAARGLDIPHIEHVINYDLPQAPEDYIHRIGRTARADAEGHALSFITSSEGGKWKAIQRLINPGSKDSDDGFFEKDNSRGDTRGRGRGGNSRGGSGRGGFGGGFGGNRSRDGERGSSERGGHSNSFGGRSSESRAPRGDSPRGDGERAPRSFGGERSERAPRRDFGDFRSEGGRSEPRGENKGRFSEGSGESTVGRQRASRAAGANPAGAQSESSSRDYTSKPVSSFGYGTKNGDRAPRGDGPRGDGPRADNDRAPRSEGGYKARADRSQSEGAYAVRPERSDDKRFGAKRSDGGSGFKSRSSEGGGSSYNPRAEKPKQRSEKRSPSGEGFKGAPKKNGNSGAGGMKRRPSAA